MIISLYFMCVSLIISFALLDTNWGYFISLLVAGTFYAIAEVKYRKIKEQIAKLEKKGDVIMDRYDFASVVDDIFKECKTIENVCNRYVQLRDDLDNLFRQNMSLIVAEKEKGGEQE